MQSPRQSEIEAGIIDQHNHVGFGLGNFAERLAEFLTEVTVAFDHFPKADNGSVADPIYELRTRDRFHSRPPAPEKLKIAIKLAQRFHQGRAVIVGARFARDEVNALSHSMRSAW